MSVSSYLPSVKFNCFCEVTYLCKPSASSLRFKTGGINWRLGPRLQINTPGVMVMYTNFIASTHNK